MISRTTASQAADALIEEHKRSEFSKASRKKRQRYSSVFGEKLVSACMQKPAIAELAIKSASRQSALILLVALWLGLMVIAAFLGRGSAVMFIGVFGGIAFRRLHHYYARQIFLNLTA